MHGVNAGTTSTATGTLNISGGTVTVPAQKFKDVLASMPNHVDLIEFDLDDANYTLAYKAAKVKGTLKGLRADGFPSTQVPEHVDIVVGVAAL